MFFPSLRTGSAAWLVALAVAGILSSTFGADSESAIVVTAEHFHLGTAGSPEWQEFAGKTPHGLRLDLRFNAHPNSTEQTLLLRQRDVKFGWGVHLNGRKLGELVRQEEELMQTLPVPAGALREGENQLSVSPPPAVDDIVVGEVILSPLPMKETLNRSTLDVKVTDADTRSGLPCRITIVDRQGALAAFYAAAQQVAASAAGPTLAVRPGVAYTANGEASLGVPPGEYTVYASRGFEYSAPSQQVTVAAGQKLPVNLEIRREVPTPGLVSSDTHIHTLTFSGHGDATIDERMITIAGEGIELPVATDHNHHTDYSEPAVRAGLQSYFTPVSGNEITTKVGHFNAFPIKFGSAVVDANVEDWPALMKAIRATPGVQVVTLNHPRDMHNGFIPFGPGNFNAATGGHERGELSFDALEVITSGALQSDFMRLYRDWFALLNRGCRIAAIASSDTHDVSRFILGQGRTYVACDDRNPAALNLDEVWSSFREGRVHVSLGLLTQITVDDRFGVGDLATDLGPQVQVKISVLGPSWSRADRLELFANGVKIRSEMFVKIRSEKLDPAVTAVEKIRVTWSIPKPAHDVHLVAIASGPGVTAPFWNLPRPYQPSSPVWEPHVIGSTNPVWLDGDGDGKFTAARGYAAAVIAREGTAPAKLLPALAAYDEAVAVQAAELCQQAGEDVRKETFQRALATSADSVQRGFTTFTASLLAE